MRVQISGYSLSLITSLPVFLGVQLIFISSLMLIFHMFELVDRLDKPVLVSGFRFPISFPPVLLSFGFLNVPSRLYSKTIRFAVHFPFKVQVEGTPLGMKMMVSNLSFGG
jgi:hypothetical protein